MAERVRVPEERVDRQPILTTPYSESDRHWRTVDDRTVDQIVDRRRTAHERIPAQPPSGQVPLPFDTPDPDPSAIDRLRGEVRAWREGGWDRTTNATKDLLEYWAREPGEGPVYSPFYAQREAIETVVYLTEVVAKDHWMVQELKQIGKDFSRGLTRLALRMATGTGKTLVMACLIAWYAVNRRREHRWDRQGLAKNVTRVVVICPGRTIRDRLLGLNPQARRNIYDDWRLLPPQLRRRLGGFPVDVINWEKLQARKSLAYREVEVKGGKGKLSRTKAIALAGGTEAAGETESLAQVWSRLLGPKRTESTERVVVLNDEGHHCWERREGEKPGVWMEALHALQRHSRYQLAQAIDLSATPIFINPPKTLIPQRLQNRPKAALVPWIVSEFALLEAMEAGLVKIPQPPSSDSQQDESALRNLFEANAGQPLVNPSGLDLVRQGADILYKDYEKTFRVWEQAGDMRVGRPVLIAVANNKKNARALFEMFGGQRTADDILIKSDFDLLSNIPQTGATESECSMHTILVLSKSNYPERAESDQIGGGALGLREVGPRRDQASDRELRAVLQTVAQPGEPGQDVRCVVSVGMLTEGWDCQRVTHILGYRKFGSELLCEQTMGRALRRRDYENLEEVRRRDSDRIEKRYPAEYATVFGVPFRGPQQTGPPPPPPPPPQQTEVRPVPDRVDEFRIWIPDFQGYTTSVPGVRLILDSDRVEKPRAIAGQKEAKIDWVETGGAIGETRILRNPNWSGPNEGAWLLAAELLHSFGESTDELDAGKANNLVRSAVLFSECLRVVNDWLDHEKITLLDVELFDGGIRDLAKSALLDCVKFENRPVQKLGVPADPLAYRRSAGDWQMFRTGLKEIAELQRSELNVAACHSKLEVKIAERLDALDGVAAFVRNHGPERFEIPYKYKGVWAKYVPDFFVRCKPDGDRVAHLVLEGKGRPDEKSEHKAWWTDNWWIPCANASGEESGQHWGRSEIGSESEVDQAIANVISEARKAR